MQKNYGAMGAGRVRGLGERGAKVRILAAWSRTSLKVAAYSQGDHVGGETPADFGVVAAR